MGIPYYFYNITKAHKHLVTESHKPCERLFLDFNGIVHVSAAKVREEAKSTTTQSELEQSILSETLKYADHVIAHCRPKRLLYVGIDGVAPLAKINQQRRRRHMAFFEPGFEPVEKKTDQVVRWDTNAISPGTEFMRKLSLALRSHFETERRFQVHISDAEEHGEGEHKIFRHIAETPHPGLDVVYGLDADLIMLGLLSPQSNVVLMREPQHFRREAQTASNFLYFDVREFRRALRKRYANTIDVESYVFLCFFLGNDFLPSLSFLNIRKQGIELLVETFVRVKHDETLLTVVDNVWRVNYGLMARIMQALGDEETERFRQVHEEYFGADLRKLRTPQARVENYGLWCRNPKQAPTVDYNWRHSYYVTLFGMLPVGDNLISEACEAYLTGVSWITEYYYNRRNPFEWFYPYHYSPTIVDVNNVLEREDRSDRPYPHVKKPTVDRITPEMQLMMIMPVQSHALLPERARVLCADKQLRYLFPRKFGVSTYLKTKLHECIPMLPALNPEAIVARLT